MKLATYQLPGTAARIGVVIDNGIIDVTELVAAGSGNMVDLITAGPAALAAINSAALAGVPIPLSSVRLLAPVPNPPELIGVGLNYRDHLAEARMALPSEPTVFNKQTSCINGPYDDVVLPASSHQLDYEGELGIVIGHAARHLSLEAAQAAIFGYVVCNDLSVRDWQFKGPTVTLGKSFDTHGPFGPWIVTADEIPSPQNLTITTRVNGEVRQHGNTADMIFSCAHIVAFLSQVMTLRPGTVIPTGTPSGVGLFRVPPGFLRAGDRVEVEISGIGRLANRIVAEESRRQRDIHQ
jgi:2-keto-4-pentenoate hydratase/2-oxohepta-3-ene-1,7-dioic acid hydratase in catechol pathway